MGSKRSEINRTPVVQNKLMAQPINIQAALVSSEKKFLKKLA